MALITFVRHQIQPGKMEQAAARVTANGDRMRQQPGFVSRRLLAAADSSDELATITVWESSEHYEAWQALNRAAKVHANSESPYIGSPMTMLYYDHEDGVDNV